MTADKLIGKSNLPLPELKKRLEGVATDTVRRRGGTWEWISDNKLRVYSSDGEPFMTMNVEHMQ